MNRHGFRSDGREPYVYKAPTPQDLLGVHSDLMDGALRADEDLLYLLYSPRWETSDAPFGVSAPPASHGVAVTTRRILISEDRHTREVAPIIQNVPFDQIIWVEVGSALLVGWFVIGFEAEGQLASISLLFPASSGMRHYQAAVREYRRIASAGSDPRCFQGTDALPDGPATLANAVRSLLFTGERVIYVARSSETWGAAARGRRRAPTCFARAGFLVLTDRGIIHALEEPGMRPEMTGFGVKATCYPLETVTFASVVETRVGETGLRFVRLHLRRGSVSFQLDAPVDGEDPRAADALVRCVERVTAEGIGLWNSLAEKRRST
jgi:hypothetical protein